MADWLPDRLPEDLDAERSFLATCCAPGAERLAAECCMDVPAEAFVHPAHRAVFEALLGLLETGEEVHSLTLKVALDRAGKLDLVGGYPGLVELLAGEDVGRPHRLAELLREKAKLRRLVHVGAELVRQAAAEEDRPEALVDQASQALSALVQTSGKGNAQEFYEGSDDWLARVVEQMEGGGPAGLRTGFARFDRLVQGFQPGNLIILAARPGIGKTALALNWAVKMAQNRARGYFHSLEMNREELMNRMVAAQGQINVRAALSGGMNRETLQRIAEAKQELDRLPLFLGDRATITVRELRAQGERIRAKHGRLDFMMVDYLTLISSPSADSRMNEAVRVGNISRGLKLMAKDLEMPVVVLAQLNREVEHRTGGRPQLSDLRDSGAIEQDADLVAFIHRKMAPLSEDEEPDRGAELILAKQRNGATGIIQLHYQGEHFLFREMARETVGAVRVERKV